VHRSAANRQIVDGDEERAGRVRGKNPVRPCRGKSEAEDGGAEDAGG
jgi:hypothetical protein